MKKGLLSCVGLFSVVFFFNTSQADIEGVWRGTLAIAPGNEMVVEFVIQATGSSGYSVVLNTPQSSSIENVAASEVSYNDEVLSVEVSELSGSFEGRLEDGTLIGQWSQVGESFPLLLSPYEEPELSEELIASVEGRWEGTITIGESPLQAVIWRFEVDESGKLVGFMGPRARSRAFIPMQNIVVTDTDLSFTVNSANGNYSGKFSPSGIDGNWSQGREATLNMTRREAEAEAEAETVDATFSEELVASLVGEWEGTIVVDENTSQDVHWRFESTEPGKITGFMGPADRGIATIPMQNIMVSETELSFDVYDAGGNFKGEISESEVKGTWTQGQDVSIAMSRK